jgi:NAD dependent epimerase/dehydratase
MNKKILITGACGFIGSHLTEFMVAKGYTVVAFDKYNRDNHHGWLENSKLKGNFQVKLGDIRDYDSVENAIRGCETVFHLAALCGIPYSYVSPLAYLKTNIEGTYNVLESSKKFNLDQVIITSTSETYGTAAKVPMDEKHRLNGQSPYAASKIAADQLALSYFNSFKTPIKIARPFNTYGPRQSLRAIIPSIISQLLFNSEKIKIGNLKPTRDFTYVTDTAEAMYKISKKKGGFGETINIGNNTEISVAELIRIISLELKAKPKILRDKKRIRPIKSEVMRLKCDNRKIKKLFNWHSQVHIKQGLRKTINWMKLNNFNFEKKFNMYNI